jgi:hypothetical protein
MMANKFILALVVPMALLCLASSAAADPFLSATGQMLFTAGNTLGASELIEDESDWIDDFHKTLSDSDMAFFFYAHVSEQDGRNEELYHLNNASGKMIPTPEPGSIVLLGAALAGGLLVRHRRKRA